MEAKQLSWMVLPIFSYGRMSLKSSVIPKHFVVTFCPLINVEFHQQNPMKSPSLGLSFNGVSLEGSFAKDVSSYDSSSINSIYHFLDVYIALFPSLNSNNFM